MIVLCTWLAGMAAARADPVALRGPVVGPTATAGLHDLSVGTPLPGNLSAAAELATNAASAGGSVGTRWVVGPDDGPRRLQAGVAGGVLVPMVQPGVAMTATGWMHGGWVGEVGSFVAGAAVPLAAGTGGARLPLLLELQGGLAAGPVHIGARLAAGPVWTPGTDVATFLEPSLALTLPR